MYFALLWLKKIVRLHVVVFWGSLLHNLSNSYCDYKSNTNTNSSNETETSHDNTVNSSVRLKP